MQIDKIINTGSEYDLKSAIHQLACVLGLSDVAKQPIWSEQCAFALVLTG
ncbi:hypothetical protein BN2497_9135 [Janthinobacterium sp. CG23_2]|nr:hypothetical protein BN2497_9135 [Janthinobacterium sp. CG23_2]CUU30965.1 hypothetical protein BN3177_9135 [Janthinobacterium sp. CG23_2]